MGNEQFSNVCIDAVIDYTNNYLLKTDDIQITKKQTIFKLQKLMFMLFGSAKHCKTTKRF